MLATYLLINCLLFDQLEIQLSASKPQFPMILSFIVGPTLHQKPAAILETKQRVKSRKE